jgi:CRP/FNR family transcriptional regulator
MLVRRSKVGGTDIPQITLPLTRDEMANFLGLTLETVSRQLSSLKKDGIIQFVDRRNFQVLDAMALQDATGDDADGGVYD